MACKYQDPWKDDKYGKLKGDKGESYFKIIFDEAVVHKTDNAYILAGHITEYQGVTRAFKAENPLTAGYCAVPIYGQEYNIPKKDDKGQYQDEKHQPSLFEKALYQEIKANEDAWMPSGAAIKGFITHIPNGMLQGQTPEQVTAMVKQNKGIEQCDLSGKLPEYKVPTAGGFKKGGGKSWGMTPDQKVEFLKKQLTADIKHVDFKSGKNLADLTEQVLLEHPGDENFISIYFDMLVACVR